MKKIALLALTFMGIQGTMAQEVMTPELLWKLGRVTPLGLSTDGRLIIYKVTTPSVSENTTTSTIYKIPVSGGQPIEIKEVDQLLKNKNISPKGDFMLTHKEVKVNQILATDLYPEYEKADAQVYNSLDYRHWDTWRDGTFNHVFLSGIPAPNVRLASPVDIMQNQPYDSPQKPHGGDEDYIWTPDGNHIIYVCKKKEGTQYAISTNTDLYQYNINTKETINLTPNNKGYDMHPEFSPNGELTWLQMKNDGYEADKNDIIVRYKGNDINLTANWDGTVDSFKWSLDGKKVYFTAPIDGTKQLFEVTFTPIKEDIKVTQLTYGNFDVTQIVGFSNTQVIVSRNDMNHATEIFSYDLKRKTWKQITQVNTATYSTIAPCKTEKRYVTTTDGKKMLVWVVLPPNFDPTKKYPTLLYCQGGPQSALTQYYSFRWNFQTIASQGYIVVAPNRRGMPGHGVQWNEQISKDWGGQVMNDYLSAIDNLANEQYVDRTRLGAVGASYGGYSVFYLAGIHKNRFKTFISHCGIFNTQSMYGTTEEVFFTNWDAGGAYWETQNPAAQKTYNQFNPINYVNQWNTPILIIQGGKDYRVPLGQAQEAFQAAQLKGIKSRFIHFPEENHWIIKPQNSLVWQKEFFKWLKETL